MQCNHLPLPVLHILPFTTSTTTTTTKSTTAPPSPYVHAIMTQIQSARPCQINLDSTVTLTRANSKRCAHTVLHDYESTACQLALWSPESLSQKLLFNSLCGFRKVCPKNWNSLNIAWVTSVTTRWPCCIRKTKEAHTYMM